MRVAIIAETFLPLVNGVTHSLQRVLEHLALRGDEVLVIAPTAGDTETADYLSTAHIVRLPSVPLAGYPDIRLAVGGTTRVRRILAAFDPDVVHLASPFELGRRAIKAAAQLGIPTIAIYQTDVPGYLGKYGFPFLEAWAWQRVTGIHSQATLTLAPSISAAAQLQKHGIERINLWGRGVDTARFHPRKRSAAFRAKVAPNGERIIGYVGRLAAEKQVEDLVALAGIPGTRLVIVGDGPQREALEALLPDAHFTGFLGGDALATAMASLDLFVHPGELETFCQTIQEAMASGVPVVATGRGGPVDLVDSSRTGWLYTPGDLGQLHGHVRDLMGDDAKRAAFAEAAFESVQGRTWPVVCELLLHQYNEAITQNALLHQR
jgi:phosphatidylinositol alpha 1,6-mannosyltransferase